MSLDFNELDLNKISDEQTVGLVNNFLTDSENGLIEWRNRAIRSMNFYRGAQWDQEDIDLNKSVGVPSLTINLIKPSVNFLAGTQKKIRKDIKIFPVKGATHLDANIITTLIKHLMDKSNAQQLISEDYRDGAITGKGWLKASIDKTYDIENGDILIEKLNSFNIFEDSNPTEYDLNISGKFIIEIRWEDQDKLMKQFPKKKDQLKSVKPDSSTASDESLIKYLSSDNKTPTFESSDDQLRIVSRDKYKFRVIECWTKTYEKRKHWIDKINFTDKIITTKEDIKIAEKATENNKRFSIIENVDAILWKIVIVNNILLEKIKEPFKVEDDKDLDLQPSVNLFPYFRYSFDFTNGRSEGIVDGLIDAQQETNKLKSQELHIMNTTANSGYTYEDGSISKDMEKELEEQGARTGLHIKYNKGFQPPAKIPPNPLPVGHQFLLEQAHRDIEDISGINKSSKGITQSQESGKLNQLRTAEALTINNTSFDNLDYTMKLLGNFLHELIRSTNVYSKEEIENILDDEDLVDIKSMEKASKKVAKKLPPPVDIREIVSTTDPALIRQSLITMLPNIYDLVLPV